MDEEEEGKGLYKGRIASAIVAPNFPAIYFTQFVLGLGFCHLSLLSCSGTVREDLVDIRQ